MIRMLDFENDLKIEPMALDVEWLEQASLFMKYSREAIKQRSILDRKKIELDVVKAELDTAIRTNPEKYGISKITEAAISNTILQDARFKVVQEELLGLHHDLEILEAAVQAFNQRKVALENLVKLCGQQYFAGPREPRDLGKESQRHYEAQKADDKVRKVMRKQ